MCRLRSRCLVVVIGPTAQALKGGVDDVHLHPECISTYSLHCSSFLGVTSEDPNYISG